MGVFKSIAKWALIGAGSVLSLIPGVGAAIGAPLIVAGANIKTATAGTSDVVSAYGGQIQATLATVGAMQQAGAAPKASYTINSIIAWVKANLFLVVGLVAAIIFIPTLLKKRR